MRGGFSLTKALLLDLDGTLLDLNFEAFFQDYLAGTAAAFADKIAPETFQRQLIASTGAMLFNDDPDLTVEEAFFRDFGSVVPLPDDAAERFERFYENEFPALGKWGKPMPGARELIEGALERGLQVVIATAPLFPETAIRERLRWAGLHDLPYRFITSSTVMRRSKPSPGYYEEIAERIGVAPEQCFMVGDESIMDGAAIAAGMDAAFVGPEKPSSSRHWLARFSQRDAIAALAAARPRLPDLQAVHRHLQGVGVL